MDVTLASDKARILVRVRRLRLRGFSSVQSRKIEREFRDTLRHLIRQGGLSGEDLKSGAQNFRKRMPLEIQCHTRDAGIGRSIAERIYKDLTQ